MNFRQWLSVANAHLEERTGMSIHDMGDYMWRDAYDNGDTPDEALEEAVEYWGIWDGFPVDAFDAWVA